MKTRIFNLIIIDESGSMCSIKKEAIDGVNETIQTIRAAQRKHADQEHYVTLVTFNSNVKTVYECVPVEEVKELTGETFLRVTAPSKVLVALGAAVPEGWLKVLSVVEGGKIVDKDVVKEEN